jgi:hypothetical protein
MRNVDDTRTGSSDVGHVGDHAPTVAAGCDDAIAHRETVDGLDPEVTACRSRGNESSRHSRCGERLPDDERVRPVGAAAVGDQQRQWTQHSCHIRGGRAAIEGFRRLGETRTCVGDLDGQRSQRESGGAVGVGSAGDAALDRLDDDERLRDDNDRQRRDNERRR